MAKRRGWHEGTRYRRRDGVYVGRVQYDRVRYQVTSTDPRERDRLLRALIRDLEQSKTPAVAPRRKSLTQVVTEWLADRALTKPATYPTWKSYARHLTEGELGRVVAAALTAPQVVDFLRAKQEAGYAQSTVRQIHRTLMACLNWAVGQDVPVPAAVLKMTAPAVEDVDRVQLTPAQVGHLFRSLDATDDPHGALWRLTWYAATRLGELLALTWDNVDLGVGTVRVVRVLVKAVDGEAVCRPGKTKQSRAILAVPPDAVDALRGHWLRQEERRDIVGPAWKTPAIGRLVFDRGDGGALRHEQAEQALYDALKQAGLPRCRPHDLRGAALSALNAAGMDVLDIQKRARHASVQTTIGAYIRGPDPSDREAAATLERLVRDG